MPATRKCVPSIHANDTVDYYAYKEILQYVLFMQVNLIKYHGRVI